MATYIVTADADELDGWTAADLAEALRPALLPLGVTVELRRTQSGGGGLQREDGDEELMVYVSQEVTRIVTEGP